MRSLLAAALLLASAGTAAAHYPGDDNWHDFGTDLGGFGPSPIGQPIGVCWYTNSSALDLYYGGGPVDPNEINEHEGGVGVDADGDCHNQASDPNVAATFGGGTNLLPGGGSGTHLDFDVKVS